MLCIIYAQGRALQRADGHHTPCSKSLQCSLGALCSLYFCADGAPIGSWWRGSGPGWRPRDVWEASMESIFVDFAPSISGVDRMLRTCRPQRRTDPPSTPWTTRRHLNQRRDTDKRGRRSARYVAGTRRLPISPRIDTYLEQVTAPQGARSARYRHTAHGAS